MRWDLDWLFGSSLFLLCMMELALGIIAKVKGINSGLLGREWWWLKEVGQKSVR